MTKLYRPSNGSEGCWFEDKFCDNCRLSETCKIVFDAMCFDVDDSKYPKEWICDDDYSNPRCTAFKDKHKPSEKLVKVADLKTMEATK